MKVLISDPTNLFENKISSRPSEHVTYYFYDDYVEFESFKSNPKFKEVIVEDIDDPRYHLAANPESFTKGLFEK